MDSTTQSPNSTDPISSQSSPVPAPAQPHPYLSPDHPHRTQSSESHLEPPAPQPQRPPDFFRQQAQQLREDLARVVLGPSDQRAQPGQPENEDPKAKKARLEQQVQQAQRELQELEVNEVRREILELMAPLDLEALKVLKQLLTTNDWLSK